MAKAVTKTVRENRKRSPQYWQGYVDALQAVNTDLGLGHLGRGDHDWLMQLIEDAKSRLEGALRTREAAKGNFECDLEVVW